MSWDLGWVAQSALMPKKSILIKVRDNGIDKMKAAMLESKQKMKNISQVKGAYSVSVPSQHPRRNKGIEERIKKDIQANQLLDIKNNKSLSFINHQLEIKQKIYQKNQQKPKNHSLFLVNFEQKALSKQDKELEQLKIEFYAGRLKQVMDQQKKIHEKDQTNPLSHMRQKLLWQKQVLEELTGEIQNKKQKVAQSFNRTLTEKQKNALGKVIQQRMKQKQRIIELNKQREIQQEERIRKLRKFNILEDSEEEK